MLFSEVIGQKKIKQRLIQTVQDNRISHAQLFLGQEGCGSLALALAYAQFISCENRQQEDSCNTCPSCLKYNKLVHPDLHFVFPVVTSKKNSKPVSDDFITEWREALLENPYMRLNQWFEKLEAENSQGGIYVHESTEIIRKLNLKTFEAEFKVMIIWMPEKMNITAANKLLKMIEEPPPKTLFILVTENSGQIIQTILSRTQLIKIPRISDLPMREALASKFDLDDQEINDVVHLANGNYIKAIEHIDSSESNEYNFKMFSNLMRLCYSKNLLEIMKWVDEITKLGREKHKNFLLYSLRMVRENFIMNTGQSELVYLAKKETAFSEKFSPFINEKNITQINDELNKAHYHIVRNGYQKIIFLDLALSLIMLLKLK